ncbi:FGGY-family carbohydrate kinase [Actinophytocola sp.]|uniref:FGGY-family carbohydrate kinase n=1 Tax=Actinophytocola sp. TaxID=1872138 RepID=UPI002ED14CAA
MTALLAGIDVGTTNCKVGVYTLDGIAVVERRRATPADAGNLVAGVFEDLRDCLDAAASTPVAVGVTGVAEGGVPLDHDLNPMAPLLWWHDERASAEARWLAGEVGRAELFVATGVDVGPGTPLATWMWLRRHQPDVVDGMRVWVGAPELVATMLCGAPLSHRTFAGRSGAYDQLRDRYDHNLLDIAAVRETQLPAHVTGAATRGPLPVGTPVVVAGHDHLVAAHAAGARDPGDVVDSLGTAEAVVTVSERVAPRAAAGSGMSWNRSADGTRWAMVSGFPHCGRLLRWLCSLASPAGDLAGLEKVAESVGARPTGIVVLPYLAGRGAPAPDPDQRLAVHDLTPGQALPDVIVAALEGVSYHARWLAEHHAEQAGTKLGGVTVFGGPGQDTAWMAAKAHVMPGEVRVTADADAACAGAALLAGAAVGLPAPVLRSDVLPRDDILADRYDAIYRDGFLSRVREVT